MVMSPRHLCSILGLRIPGHATAFSPGVYPKFLPTGPTRSSPALSLPSAPLLLPIPCLLLLPILYLPLLLVSCLPTGSIVMFVLGWPSVPHPMPLTARVRWFVDSRCQVSTLSWDGRVLPRVLPLELLLLRGLCVGRRGLCSPRAVGDRQFVEALAWRFLLLVVLVLVLALFLALVSAARRINHLVTEIRSGGVV